MTTIPIRLYHYYEASRAPFLSMSEADPSTFTSIMEQVGRTPISENRFDTQEKRDSYRFFRGYTEQKMRARFIEKGGEPTLTAPRYMTLGPSKWFYDWYEDARAIEIPLNAFDEKHISFTKNELTLLYDALCAGTIMTVQLLNYRARHHTDDPEKLRQENFGSALENARRFLEFDREVFTNHVIKHSD